MLTDLQWGRRTYIMGILNVTPDSFSDGGLYATVDAAVARAREMAAQGADIVDVGGESARPGYVPISAAEELQRVLPAIQALAPRLGIPISIDTQKAEVAKAALAAGARIINDISGLADPGMRQVAAEAGVPVILMHNRRDPVYRELVDDVIEDLRNAADRARKAGVDPTDIIVDPGIGFGKSAEQSLEMIRRLPDLRVLGYPVLVGPSRKSPIGKVLDLPAAERLEGTAALVALSVAGGADIVRVHDVKEMARVARMADAVVRRAGASFLPQRLAPADETPEPDDRICIQGLVFTAAHGVYPEEQTTRQPFEVDLELLVDAGRAARHDALAQAVDYQRVVAEVAAVVSKGEGEGFHLIETVADRLADHLLALFPVGQVTVRVHKPRAPIGVPFRDLFVEVRRRRGGKR